MGVGEGKALANGRARPCTACRRPMQADNCNTLIATPPPPGARPCRAVCALASPAFAYGSRNGHQQWRRMAQAEAPGASKPRRVYPASTQKKKN